MISPRTQSKRLLALADQLEVGNDLTPEQRAYLVACFRAMGRGEDGNSVFGLSYTKGRSESDEKRRENLRLMFSWIAGAIDPAGGSPWTLKEALDRAAEISNTKGSPFRPMTRRALERAWYNPKYRYLRALVFSNTDLHSPLKY